MVAERPDEGASLLAQRGGLLRLAQIVGINSDQTSAGS
jgi:hypothetical protein